MPQNGGLQTAAIYFAVLEVGSLRQEVTLVRFWLGGGPLPGCRLLSPCGGQRRREANSHDCDQGTNPVREDSALMTSVLITFQRHHLLIGIGF